MTGATFTAPAKKSKRCPWCSKMVPVGAEAVVTDDRRVVTRQQWIAQGAYVRGAWHNWHPACYAARQEAARVDAHELVYLRTLTRVEREAHDDLTPTEQRARVVAHLAEVGA